MSLRRLSAAALAAEAAHLLANFEATQGKMRLGKRETISLRARQLRTQRPNPMPTPRTLPQRSRTAPFSRRSSGPNRSSPLLTAGSRMPSVSAFRMNTCKSVSKQRTLTIFRMNTYVKTRGGRRGARDTLAHCISCVRQPSICFPLLCALCACVANHLRRFSFCAIACYRPHL